MISRLIPIFLFVLSAAVAGASSPLEGRILRHYTVRDGLASNAIYSICQDRKGRMWFGTIDGLHSFDGSVIREWRDPSVKTLGNIVSAIVEDDNDGLWIGSNAGVSLFDLRHECFRELHVESDSGIKLRGEVVSVVIDSKGSVWISTLGQGVYRYDPVTCNLVQYTSRIRICNDYVRRILEDSNGRIWAATGEGLCLYNPVQDRFSDIPCEEKRTLNVTSLFEDSAHRLWVGCADGLYLYDPRAGSVVEKLVEKGKDSLFRVRDIKEWNNGELLLVSDQGLTSYNILTGESVLTTSGSGNSSGLNDNYLHCLYIDRDQALWIGSYFGGVNYVSPSQNLFIHRHTGNTNLKARIVSCFCEGENGEIWIGSDDAGVFRWDRTPSGFSSLLPGNLGIASLYKNIHALLYDSGKLYVGMYLGGLDVIDLKTGTVENHTSGKSPESLYSPSIYSIYRDSYGDVWIGTTEGLNRLNRNTGGFDRIFQVHPADVSSIIEDKRGFLWASTGDKGIFRYNRRTGEWKRFSTMDDGENASDIIPTDNIITSECDPDGRLWFGTTGCGMLEFDYGTESFRRTALPAWVRNVNKIAACGPQLWLGTSNGLYRYDPNDSTLFYFNRNSGLQDDVFLPNSGLLLSDGSMLMGGINGFNEFRPDLIAHQSIRPDLILTELKVFNESPDFNAQGSFPESLTYADGLSLGHDQNVFSFRVSPLNYADPSGNRFICILEGFDKEWKESESSVPVSYTNLPPGSYVFKARAYDGNGGWSTDAFEFPITVRSPWWESWPMIAAYILAVLTVLWLGWRWFRHRQRKKMDQMAAEKDRELYNMKMDFFTSIVHELRTPLTLIISPLENLLKSPDTPDSMVPQLAVMDRNGKRLLNLVNHLMDFRKAESGVIQLSMENLDISENLEGICHPFSSSASLNGRTLSLTLPEGRCVGKFDREAFTQMVANLLSNALKFAEKEIRVLLAVLADGRYRVSVSNDGPEIPVEERGKIFEAFYQEASTRASGITGTGVGLFLVKRYAEIMDAEVGVECKGGWTEFYIDFKSIGSDVVEEPDGENSGDERDENGKDRILFVDDNPEMLAFLENLFGENYEVRTASDAKEAFSVILGWLPDIIVSDVMMPGIDGVEFCRRIKEDLRTSHIPVMLLTAKVDERDQIAGFDGGADMYVTKPFSVEVIKARLRALLSNRSLLREKVARTPERIGQIAGGTKIDREFFDKIKNVVSERMADPDFSVDMLAREVGVSRTGLFTKIKAVAGMTPNDFIRLMRLSRAAELLSSGDARVNEVCWQVGFSSRSHFAKSFQSHFGVPPSEYRKPRRNADVDAPLCK